MLGPVVQGGGIEGRATGCRVRLPVPAESRWCEPDRRRTRSAVDTALRPRRTSPCERDVPRVYLLSQGCRRCRTTAVTYWRRAVSAAGSCTCLTLATSPLPLCRITICVQDREYDDEVAFHREVHGVGKAPKQRAADSGPEVLILEGASGDPIVKRATDRGTPDPVRVARSRTTGTSPRCRDRLAARQPADTRSPIRVRQAIEHVTGGPRAAGISAILGKPLFSKDQMRLRHRNLARSLGDAVPESLQIADLFSLRERAEPLGLGEGRWLHFSPALSRSRGHAVTLRSGAISCQRARKDTAAQLARRNRA